MLVWKCHSRTSICTFIHVSFLRLVILRSFSTAAKIISELKLAFSRITNILRTPEVLEINYPETINEKNAIEIENMNARWENKIKTFETESSEFETNEGFSFKNLNIEIKKGKLNIIYGRVGSGKTNFFHLLINEMPYVEGKIRISGNMSLFEQEPMIFGGTIKENIIFGKEENSQKLNEIIEITCLDQDLLGFQKGIDEELGEKGLNISGGQKARICLARALYSDADIYLLDDPFAALDSNVAINIFENVILKYLKGKIVILSTHHLNFASYANKILFLDHGNLVDQGTKSEIFRRNPQLLSIFEEKSDEEEEKIYEEEQKEDLKLVKAKSLEKSLPEQPKSQSYPQEKVKTQNVEKSVVTFQTYRFFFSLLRPSIMLILFFFLEFGGKTGFIASTKLLGDWSARVYSYSDGLKFNLIVFLVSFVCIFVSPFLFVQIFLNACYEIHNKMINSLVRAKSVFFDKNPSGRILNRFSNDVGIIDVQLQLNLFEIIDGLFQFFPLFVSIWFIQPFLFFLTLGQIILSMFLVKYFDYPIMKSKLLDLGGRSPLYSHFNLSLSGLKNSKGFPSRRLL